jgi:hypothetical protein
MLLNNYLNCSESDAGGLDGGLFCADPAAFKAVMNDPAIIYMGRVFGYHLLVFRQTKAPGGLRIKMGCRWFTLAEAKKHWSSKTHGGWSLSQTRRAKAMLDMLPVIKRAANYKWGIKYRYDK